MSDANHEGKIAYVVHPVTPEQKKKLRGEGFKIVDARFAPDGEDIPAANKESKAKPKANTKED